MNRSNETASPSDATASEPAGRSLGEGLAGTSLSNDDPTVGAGPDQRGWASPIETGQFDLGIEAKTTLLLLLRRRKTIAALTFVAMAVGVGLTFVLPSQYQSRVLMLQSTDDNLSALGLGQAAGIASTLGLSLGAPSVAMAYPDILKSRQIRERMLDRRFRVESGEERSLLSLLHPRGETPEVQRAKALGILGRKVKVRVDRETGVLELAVTAPGPLLAQQMSAAYVEELIRIENELKSAAAHTNRQFVEKRLGETEAALRTTEEAYESFQEQNPRLGTDPELHLRAARLERDVRAQEEVYLTLVREHELAKIEENRETPGIQIIDPPSRPLGRSSPILLKNVVLCAFLGCIAASLFVVGWEYGSAARLQFADAWTRDRRQPGWNGQVGS